MNAALVATAVRKSYGDMDALRGVSLTVDSGEVYALVGPNGAGKTTLVRCLTGTMAPDDGDVSLFGDRPRHAAKDRVGLLPQDFRPPDRLTPGELVTYYAGLYDDARDVDVVLRDVGLDAERDTHYKELSGGEKRRACVATALVNDPDILFLDEPTTAVDPVGRRALWTVFEDLADAGTAVFLTTHDMAEAERLADRVGLIADGELVAEGSPEDLVEAHGGPTRLVVETGANAEFIEDIPWSVHDAEDGLVFENVDPEDVGAIIDALEDADIAFDRLTWREPDLEDAYLALADGLVAEGEIEHVEEAGGAASPAHETDEVDA